MFLSYGLKKCLLTSNLQKSKIQKVSFTSLSKNMADTDNIFDFFSNFVG